MNEQIVFQYDPLGKISKNFIKAEKHILSMYRGTAYAFIEPDCSPFLKKDLRLVTSKGVELKEGIDYRLSVPFINDGHINDCFEIIEIVNSNFFNSVIYVDYRTLGSNLVYPERRILELLINREINPSQISWSSVQNKPGRYPIEPHIHKLSHFYGFEKHIELIKEKVVEQLSRYAQLILDFNEHVNTDNAHNLTATDYNAYRLSKLKAISVSDLQNLNLLDGFRYLTPKSLKAYMDNLYVKSLADENLTLMGDVNFVQGADFTLEMTSYNSFSNYSASIDVGTINIVGNKIKFSFFLSDPVGEHEFTINVDGVEVKRKFKLSSAAIKKPKIYGIDSGSEVSSTIVARTSNFETNPAGRDSLSEVVYEISEDPSFENVSVRHSVDRTTNATLPALNINRTYWIRAKHIGNVLESEYSEVISFKTRG